MQIFKLLLMASKKITFMKYFTMIVIMQKKSKVQKSPQQNYGITFSTNFFLSS